MTKKSCTTTFNIMTAGLSGEIVIKPVEGELIEKYGVKVILHKVISPNPNYYMWYYTEYNTGMKMFDSGNMLKNFPNPSHKKALEIFEKFFNDPDLTELGKQDKLNKINELIDENVRIYGKANQ